MRRRLRGASVVVLMAACALSEAGNDRRSIARVVRSVSLSELVSGSALAGVSPPASEQVAGASEGAPTVCPDGMQFVSGAYCPKAVHRCKRWLDPPGKFRRCGEYAKPAQCLGKRRTLAFCIERDEHRLAGEKLPVNRLSFVAAQRVCTAEGKRICRESEWNFACEGEELRPYPYGWERDRAACNADHVLIAGGAHTVRDLRSPAGAYPRCMSPFGVLDMTGNLEEFVARDDRPTRPAMKGAHWLPGRNTCRAHQTIHGPGYSGVETGFRCCSDPPGPGS